MYAKNVNINPCNMCMPMGGVLAFKGIAGSVVIIHGSQGCSTYIRRHIAEHFNEPLDVASSSLNEKGTIYGGENNLKVGLGNLIKVYKPKVIGILTTCLAETIGEDIARISSSYLYENPGTKVVLIPVNTPGYGGSHTEGFFYSLRKIIEQLSKKTEKREKTEKIGMIVPNISPADIRELKRILKAFSIQFVLLPDFSDSLDGEYTKDYKKISNKGTKIKDIEALPGFKAVIEFSTTISDELSPGVYLEENFKVPLYRIPLPMGLRYTDQFMKTLESLSGKKVPTSFLQERGRLVDAMIDSHKHNAQGKAAIFNEPEYLLALSSLLQENGVEIQVAATGSEKTQLKNAKAMENINLFQGADFDLIFREIEGKGVNLAIGNSDGRCLTEKKDIPLIRFGFPIHDRMGGGRILSLGYSGSIEMLDRITNTILEKKLSGYRRGIR